MKEFHVSRQSRDRYQFDQSIFSFNGNVIFANFHAARLFAQQMNSRRDLLRFPEEAIKAGQINAMGLLDEILHLVIELYRRQRNPQVMSAAEVWLDERLGTEEVDRAIYQFVAEFPPISVYRHEMTITEYLESESDGVPNRQNALEEIMMLWIANKNPAQSKYGELFDDSHLQTETAYIPILNHLYAFFETQPRFGPDHQNLIDLLRAPAIAHPYSLEDQLEFVRNRWGEQLGRVLYRLLSSLDFIKEENKPIFAGGGPGPIEIPVFGTGAMAGDAEAERFSEDREWMPRLVLMAKNTYVWLDQLSRKYQRKISRLDEIPDEELGQLAQWGFTGLWLIGLWERSNASARIKQLCGNPEAISSAYSLAGYQIAWDLGGEDAYRNLRERAWQRGIRLASDMVPNHMGIDSSWVVDHPDWFLSVDYSPYPSYSFNGPNLSADDRVGIYIEDHYYSRTDAAVVFKRVDHRSGQAIYIYHGNDGTSMPWNDTAQLNYLNPQVREAIIQTILDVARRFPIIRFDAAMTLAKRHVQRLWFPEPGSGGAIPSRSDHALTKEQFDALMPIEFWREVVDRAAIEAPDTLLLAEAFWMMEGYFVRTLGMHRVYNSAFMNLLRNEDNAKYRIVMKNTLEFDPEILKRYVNFMNNPDERTAVDQFGKGDKYFGICVLMATLPGLPMFGHGQIEGFSEKYGMEFRRAYWDEQIDPWLVERHQREIFPLLHRRALFAGVSNFLLYDFTTPFGGVNEDVYAFSNGLGSERALVVFHNKFGSTDGWIKSSVGFSAKDGDGKQIIQNSLVDGLNIHPSEDQYVIYRDQISGLEYIRPSLELADKGFFIHLNAYEYHVFTDFRVVIDDQWKSYAQLNNYLNGRGVPSVQEALKELLLQPVVTPFRLIANPGYLSYLMFNRLDSENPVLPEGLLKEAEKKSRNLLEGIAYHTVRILSIPDLSESSVAALNGTLNLSLLPNQTPLNGGLFQKACEFFLTNLDENQHRWYALHLYPFIFNLSVSMDETNSKQQTLSWLDEWQFLRIIKETLASLGLDETQKDEISTALRVMIGEQDWFESVGQKPLFEIVEHWLADVEVQRILRINRYQDAIWFHKEGLEDFLWWMMAVTIIQSASDPRATSVQIVERMIAAYEITLKLQDLAPKSGYQLEKLLSLIED
jgi:glycosidase